MRDQSMGIAKALVLEEFSKPFVLREFPLPEPGPGEVLARVTAAGVCGSDIHMHAGHDPRTPLPIIPGHEGVGEVVTIGHNAALYDGGRLSEGMAIVWERSLTCGKCYFCQRFQRNLCVERKVYGINISSEEPPHLSGNYATHILLRKGTAIFQRDPRFDPAVLVAATCSGTTAAHAHESAVFPGGDTIVIYGSGPVAAFQIAFALDVSAQWVSVITRSPGVKSELATAFGADEVLFRSEMDSESIVQHFLEKTNGIGVDTVVDTTPDPQVFHEAIRIVRRGGVYVNPGLGIPADPVPFELYSELVNKNLLILGVWASDMRHLEKSLELVQSGEFPFEKLVTHRFSLEEHEEAWRVLRDREGVKVVFEP